MGTITLTNLKYARTAVVKTLFTEFWRWAGAVLERVVVVVVVVVIVAVILVRTRLSSKGQALFLSEE
jgi:hypothetical protein